MRFGYFILRVDSENDGLIALLESDKPMEAIGWHQLAGSALDFYDELAALADDELEGKTPKLVEAFRAGPGALLAYCNANITVSNFVLGEF